MQRKDPCSFCDAVVCPIAFLPMIPARAQTSAVVAGGHTGKNECMDKGRGGDKMGHALNTRLALDRGCSTSAQSSWSEPTLANPILANVEVLVECKDFGFSELIVWFFCNWLFKFFCVFE